jgi:class 3 adenylate cyclase
MHRVVDSCRVGAAWRHCRAAHRVNTGPVIAGDARLGQRLVTGGAVNVAARFEQTAYLGAVVIGDLTRRLAGDGAVVTELQPLTLRARPNR